MSMKNFKSGKIYLIFVIILKILSSMMTLIKKVIGKMKDEYGGDIVDEFIGNHNHRCT